jgi:flagellar hook-associated protein 3 FlgL
MRISDSAVFDNVKRQVNKAREGVLTAQEQASTGMRVNKPSDDPVAAAQARREASRKALADAGKSATEQAQGQLEATDSALNDVFEALTSARSLAVQGASSTMGPENRTAAANEVRKIREQMVALGNTNINGRYVFAGYRDQSPAFDPSGAFVGDTATKEVQALPGLKVAASISGQAVFGSNTSDDLLGSLDALASALESNDIDAVQATIKGLNINQERVLNVRSQVGAMIDSVQVANSIADQQSYRSQLEIGRLVQVDEITAATNFIQAKGALDAALTIAQQIPVGGLAAK